MANAPTPSLSTSSGTPLVQTWADEEYADDVNMSIPESVALNNMPAVHELDPVAEIDDAKDSGTEEGDQPPPNLIQEDSQDEKNAKTEVHLSNLVESYANQFQDQRREEDRPYQLHARQRDAPRKCHMGEERFDQYVKDRAARNLKKKKKNKKRNEAREHMVL